MIYRQPVSFRSFECPFFVHVRLSIKRPRHLHIPGLSIAHLPSSAARRTSSRPPPPPCPASGAASTPGGRARREASRTACARSRRPSCLKGGKVKARIDDFGALVAGRIQRPFEEGGGGCWLHSVTYTCCSRRLFVCLDKQR